MPSRDLPTLALDPQRGWKQTVLTVAATMVIGGLGLLFTGGPSEPATQAPETEAAAEPCSRAAGEARAEEMLAEEALPREAGSGQKARRAADAIEPEGNPNPEKDGKETSSCGGYGVESSAPEADFLRPAFH